MAQRGQQAPLPAERPGWGVARLLVPLQWLGLLGGGQPTPRLPVQAAVAGEAEAVLVAVEMQCAGCLRPAAGTWGSGRGGRGEAVLVRLASSSLRIPTKQGASHQKPSSPNFSVMPLSCHMKTFVHSPMPSLMSGSSVSVNG